MLDSKNPTLLDFMEDRVLCLIIADQDNGEFVPVINADISRDYDDIVDFTGEIANLIDNLLSTMSSNLDVPIDKLYEIMLNHITYKIHKKPFHVYSPLKPQ